MFEKEAEEFVDSKKSFWRQGRTCIDSVRQAYQKGVEFGYNKANEWHYVKDGDLPKHEVNVLVLYNVQCIDIAHYNYDYKEWHFRDSILRDVIAWKEIILQSKNTSMRKPSSFFIGR